MIYLYILIYLIGYVLAYYLTKKTFRYGGWQDDWEWPDVIISLLLSIFSWISVLAALISLGLFALSDWESKSKPPKWL